MSNPLPLGLETALVEWGSSEPFSVFRASSAPTSVGAEGRVPAAAGEKLCKRAGGCEPWANFRWAWTRGLQTES